MPRARGSGLARAVAVVLLLAVVGVLGPVPAARAASYPIAPLAFDRLLLSNLSAPSIGPGASGAIAYRLSDPASFAALGSVVLGFEVYALNGYPGDDVGPVPVANAPVLENATASGLEVNVTVGALAPGSSVVGSVGVTTSSATPAGTYAVRTSLAFVANHTAYLFLSRGWFSATAWQNATGSANGSLTVNASRLGVSGIVPETAVYVASSSWPIAIGALVAVGLVLVGVGAWSYFRKGPGSSSGTAAAPAPGSTNAPSAFGSSRSSPGDSRSS